MSRDLVRHKRAALKKARQYARSGNGLWAGVWLERANQFWPVTSRERNAVQKLLSARRRR